MERSRLILLVWIAESLTQGYGMAGRGKSMHKQFRLTADQIKPIAVGLGSCIASDRITVDGLPVGYMYREASDGGVDSGWRFFAGDETQAYTDDPSHFAIYDVNTIANYDATIIPLLSAPEGSAYGRGDAGQWLKEDPPIDPDA